MKQNLLVIGAMLLFSAGSAAATDLNVAPESGADITAALASAKEGVTDIGEIVITLAEGGQYTVSGSLEVAGNLTIFGHGASIDAKDLTAPFVLMSATPAIEAGETGFYALDHVRFDNVNISGLTQQLFYANKTKYYINEVVTDGCNIQLAGGNKTIYDFNGGGVVGNLTINGSTISSYPANTGFLFSSQAGQKATEYNPDAVQTFTVNASTLYNIANGKNLCNHRQNGQKWLTYNVTKSILIDCGKKGQFVQGFNGGQSSTNPTYDVDTNSFLWGTPGEFAVQPENEPSEGLFKNTLGEPTSTFPDANAGIFTLNAWSSQAEAQVGAPEWLVPYVAGHFIETPDSLDLSAFLAEQIADSTMSYYQFTLAPGTVYELSGVADTKFAEVAFVGDASNRPVIKVTAEGKFVNMNGIQFKNVNFDMTDAPMSALVYMTETPDSCLSTKYNGLQATYEGIKDGFVLDNPISFRSCDFRNLPSRLFASGTKDWAIRTFDIIDCVMQFNKKDGNAVISFEEAWSGVNGIKDLTIKNSTFYNTGDVTKARFIRYGNKNNAKPTVIYGPNATSNHVIEGCTFYQTFNGNKWANNMPEVKEFIVTLNSSILYNIDRPDEWFSRSGKITCNSDKNNLAWLAGDENGDNIRKELEEIAVVVNPEFAGPLDRPYALDENFGGVNFRAMAQAADSLKCGDPRWFSAPAGVPVTVIPDGTNLTTFLAEKIAEGSKAYYRYELVAGGNYQLTDTTDLKLADVALVGDATSRASIKVTEGGAFLNQNGVEFHNVNFDMTDAPMSALVIMSADPDSCFSTKYNGLQALSADVKEGFVVDNPISFKNCDFTNLPSRLFASGTKDWAVRKFDIINCVMQFNKKDGNAVISFEEAWSGVNGIKDLTIKNSTFYNTGDVTKARFIRYGNKNNARPFAVYGPNATSRHLIDGCTFYQTFNGNKFANNMPEVKEFIVEINNSILYNIDRPDEWFSRSGKITCESNNNNMAWLAGDENGTNIRKELAAIAIIQNPAFVGPLNVAYDPAVDFGGVNFRPYNEICLSKKIGDPRWFNAPAPALNVEIPDGSEIAAFVAENVPEAAAVPMTLTMLPGANYTLVDSADLKLANIAFVGDADKRPTVVISGNGTFLSQNGLSFQGINFDMTEAPVTSFITITADPDSCFSTKYLGLKELGTKDGFIYENPIAIESCNFRNLPGSIIYTAQMNGGNSGWGFKNISIINSVVQFNKKNGKAAISLEENWGAAGIAVMTLTNSTFYNLENYNARFLRYGIRTKPEQIFGPGPTTKHTISYCTFSKTFTDSQFANNMDNSGLEANINHCIFYDINRLDQYCFRSGTSQVSSDNIAWLAGNEENLHSNVEKMAEIVDPDFVGPIDLPFDLAEKFGGVNFCPQNETAKNNKIGDPRWFDITTAIVTVNADENADGPVEYFNLQGIRVAADNLVPGIYVKRQGTTTSKVYVK